MDFIPTFRFIASIFIFGLLLYVYNPIITYLQYNFETYGIYANAMFFLWGCLALVNLFGSGIKLVMAMQEKKGF